MKLHSLLLLALVSTAAAAPLTAERLRESEARQQQVQGDAGRLVGQLDMMLDEYARNGLEVGDDVKTVKALRDSLERMSGSEMKAVIDLLEKARAVNDAGEAKKTVADAYASQKAILTRMQRLLAEHRRNQQALELANQISQLADRQAANLLNGITLGQWSGGRKPETLEKEMQANLEWQKSEQQAIAEELKLSREKLAAFAKDAINAEQTARFEKGIAAIGKVQPNVEGAAEALKAGQLFKAVADEKIARDAMRQIAREVAPPKDRAETLREAEKQLSKILADQKDLVANTEKAQASPNFDQWAQQKIADKTLDKKWKSQPIEKLRENGQLQNQFKGENEEKARNLAGLEPNQGDLAAKSDGLAQDLAKEAPNAAQSLQGAQGKMQEARAAMTDKNAAGALKHEKEAIAAMQAAHAEIAAEATKAEALVGKSGDPVKDLQALQAQAQQLAQQEAAAAKNPDKSQQAALAQKIDQLAQQAGQMAPQAAQAAQQAAQVAQQAAQNAQQAAQAAQAGQPAQAAQQQAAAGQQQAQAAQNLQQAAQQLGQQAAEMQQAQQQLAAAQQADVQLAAIIQAEQQLEMETAKALAQGKPKEDWRYKGQSVKQIEIQGQTDTFRAALPANLADANPVLEAASAAMSEARAQLEKPDGAPAKAAELRALDALFKAQRALAQVMDQAQEALGQPEPAAAANQMQQAAAQLAQAGQQLAQAQQNLQEAQAAQAQQAAAQAQQAAAQAAQQAAAQAGEPVAAQQASQQAAQAGQQAAQAGKQAAAEAQQAAGQLAKAAQQASQAAAQSGAEMSPAGQQAAQQAAQAAAEAAAQAAGQNTPGAQAQAAQAQTALAQAQAALGQAQAGLSPAGGPPTPGEGPPGQGPPGSKPGQKPGKGAGKKTQSSMAESDGAKGYEPGSEEGVQRGSRTANAGRKPIFTSLPPRERAAIEQGQAEKYPEEYGPLVEQYLRNLANESGAKK